MIEDLVAYLKADPTLTTLVGGRLYPAQASQDPTAPYIVYRIQSDLGRTKANNVREMLVGFSIFAKTALVAETIKRRLDVLLDKDAAIVVPSTCHHIYSCWLFGGNSMYEQDTELHHRAALYTLLYV